MRSWPAPFLPALPGSCGPVRVRQGAGDTPVEVATGESVSLYVCGITPYDATHLGHAATYVTFDILHRVLLDQGARVRFVENVTDVDDPLFERAARDGLDWRELAGVETDLFREDMTALAVIPPEAFVGVEEALPTIAAAVAELVAAGAAYALPVPDSDATAGQDIYLDLTRQPDFGLVSGWDEQQMDEVFADRGGDPDRPGKRHRFDPLLWRAQRPGEPSWDLAGLGPGRPGWHIECTAIAREYLGLPLDVQGGGRDLVFPHHEMSATQANALPHDHDYARIYLHQGMVGYAGEKMSKSRGNLVLVSRLLEQGVDPVAIRLALLAHHYRDDWEYTDDVLTQALSRLTRWRAALSRELTAPAEPLISEVRAALCDDLDTPAALAAVDRWVQAGEAGPGVEGSGGVVARALDALLGVRV